VSDRPTPIDSAPFSHVDTVISAYADATTEAERLFYLRCIARALEQIAGHLHERLGALVDAATRLKVRAYSWTYTQYWNMVIGVGCTPTQAIADFKLSPGDEVAIGELLCLAEDAARSRLELEELPSEWSAHRQRAMRELVNVRLGGA
jgi:hypothetical protein